MLGQILSSLVGVSVSKLFALSPHADSLRWLAGSVACASATAVMALTGTVHPPAGATAIIAVLEDDVVALGWFFTPVMGLGCGLMLAVALLLNNIQRRFPVYWWSPEEVGQFWTQRRRQRRRGRRQGGNDIDSDDSKNNNKTDGEDEENRIGHHEHELVGITKFVTNGPDADDDPSTSLESVATLAAPRVVITRGLVMASRNLYLRPDEKQFLESLSQRL